jgi:hypothetical protein
LTALVAFSGRSTTLPKASTRLIELVIAPKPTQEIPESATMTIENIVKNLGRRPTLIATA